MGVFDLCAVHAAPALRFLSFADFRLGSATSGDCGGLDTSALVRSYPEGDVLAVRSSAPIAEGAIVQVEFKSVRYEGVTSTVIARPGCVVKNGGTHRIVSEPQAFIRFGQSLTLMYSNDGRRLAKLDAELLR